MPRERETPTSAPHGPTPPDSAAHNVTRPGRNSILAGCLCVIASQAAAAGGGGKAELNRIRFAAGASSATVSGHLRGDEQAEFVFGARKGQIATLRIESIPRGQYTAFRLFQPGGAFASRYDINYTWSGTLPHDGDYQVWVSLRPTEEVRSARFRLTLTVR